MSSAICQNFVQNAWKKELCSNCFKSKDEHVAAKPKVVRLVSDGDVAGIIRDPTKSKPKLTVEFTKELTQFIGYGGEDWLSGDEEADDDDNDVDLSEEDLLLTDSDEEECVKEMRKLTKKNTSYNTVSLSDLTEKKNSHAQLMLGKPLLDSEGKKHTLLVSVTPFGEDTPPRKQAAKAPGNSNVVLTSYTKNDGEKSLLDEISETLENGKNPIQIMSKNKENTGQVQTKRAVSLARAPALKLDKPVVFQTSTAKIELLNAKNLKKAEVNNNDVSKVIKSDVVTSTKLIQSEIQNSAPYVSPPPKDDKPTSREQAGKPDGSEDPERPELPALPLTPPPPLETQASFLHGSGGAVPPTGEKPKIPSKPATVLIRKAISVSQPLTPPQTFTTFSKEPAPVDRQDPDSDPKANKRRAPMPPEEQAGPLYARNSCGSVNSDSPVVREKEKRERASSCVPKIYAQEYAAPAPAPRRLLSISTDNLLVEDKRKEKSKGRFSLRKFLRMGSSKDLVRLSGDSEDGLDGPKPRPRLVIVHPSELNGSKVEVVAKPVDSPKAAKPPPPPRNYENWKQQPVTHPPPKSVEILNKQRQLSRSNSGSSVDKKMETVYANIGEVRSSIVPNKPVRTASMREREAQQQQQTRKHHYEPVGKPSEHVYDYVNNGSGRSSSPDSDSSRGGKNSPEAKTARLNKRSDSSIDVSGEYFKYGNIPRSMSLTYCGSETESEIYSPYSFCGSESEVTEDDHDWIQNGRTHKLRSRKGRSIVHRSLEDNYGAVVVANHEALAQVLENIQQSVHVQPALRGLKTSPNLRLADFTIKTSLQPVFVGAKSFHQALWGSQHVTLLFSTGLATSSTLSLGTFSLNAVTEFNDLVPREYLADPKNKNDTKQVQATVHVLPWLQVYTIDSYGEMLRSKPNQDETHRDAFFVLLQVVNALKMLQAQGVEELPLSLDSFVLCREVDRDTHYRLCIMQGLSSDASPFSTEGKLGTLCVCAAKALSLLQPSTKTATLIQSLLSNERSVSLTQVKSILEFSLWGPSDVSLGSTVRERELTLQRWLDLQRATVLHGLVCARVQLTVYEECHLLFLVRSNARMTSDASMLIESNNLKYSHSSRA
ncbi:uncharacterized protein LOC132702615 [Cylas formicarius]|uniref:uncharacterized protein LOC132702615 n=1 Tax=Cylas formicarius TaxID=197179 RepID=UPI00295840CD|nr:uncharacterized protein LOC132702615 [Cylas formicarius]